MTTVSLNAPGRVAADGRSARPLAGTTVLILVENLSVPFDRRVWQESRALIRFGCEVVVICPRGTNHDSAPYEVIEGVHIFRYDLTPAQGGPLGYAREYTLAFARIRNLVARVSRHWRFDVIHACNPPDFLLLAAASVRGAHGAALVFDHHDLVPELCLSRFGNRRLLRRASLAAEGFTFRLADVVISTNQSYRDIAVGRGKQDPADVFVVRNAPDPATFRRVPADPALRRGADHLIAYLGIMGPQDGVDHALHALHELRRTRADWRAIFVGSGDVLEEMRRLAQSLRLSDVVEFTGRITDVGELTTVLSSATVGLCPDPPTPLNRVSTMNKTLEYMAVGLPVVSYDLPETRFSARDAALYAASPRPRALAAAVSELLDAPERRRQMAEAGQRLIHGELSWKQSEARLLRAYERALEKRRKLGSRPAGMLAPGRPEPYPEPAR